MVATLVIALGLITGYFEGNQHLFFMCVNRFLLGSPASSHSPKKFRTS